jgi:hypothetical protein
MPNRDRLKIKLPADIAAVASPISDEGLLRAATIQNSRPNEAEKAEFAMMASELR